MHFHIKLVHFREQKLSSVYQNCRLNVKLDLRVNEPLKDHSKMEFSGVWSTCSLLLLLDLVRCHSTQKVKIYIIGIKIGHLRHFFDGQFFPFESK